MLLLDNSAWARLREPRLGADRIEWIADRVPEFATCLPFLLEAGYSARSARDYDEITAQLDDFMRVPITEEVERLALEAQRDLARMGHHRVAVSDLMIAACAHVARAGVLHYDHDFDRIAEMTRLAYRSEWLAPAGSI
jgi:predicted nucleic acid-binding protein